MTQVDRYIGVTVLKTTVVVFFAFLALTSLFTLIEELQETAESYELRHALLYLLYTLPRRTHELVPYVLFLSALIGLGVLANHSEITVLRSSGVSLGRIFMATSVPVLALVMAAAALGEWVAPRGEAAGEALRSRALDADNVISLGRAGYWYREGGMFTRVAALGPDGELVGVVQFELAGDNRLLLSRRAASARYDSREGHWRLLDVHETRFGPASETVQVERHDEIAWASQADPRMLSAKVLVDPNKLSFADLSFQIDYMRREGLNADRYEIARWSKLLQPVAILGLVLIALGFVVGPLREVSIGVRLTVGILVGLGFKYLQDLFAPMTAVFDLPPVLAVTIPIAVCWLGGAVLLRRAA